jgi:nucleoside-diphosphate-sugar epimerase
MSTGKILISRATGDTGGYAIEQLVQKGHQVRALVQGPDDRSKRLEDKGVEVVAGDYLELDAMRTAVNGNVSFHRSTRAAYSTTMRNPGSTGSAEPSPHPRDLLPGRYPDPQSKRSTDWPPRFGPT